MTTTRLDSTGRDVTETPGPWTEDDVEVCQTNYNHPTIISGQHTNGPARIWCRQCVEGAEWFDTGETHMHRVRSAVRNGEFFQ